MGQSFIEFVRAKIFCKDVCDEIEVSERPDFMIFHSYSARASEGTPYTGSSPVVSALLWLMAARLIHANAKECSGSAVKFRHCPATVMRAPGKSKSQEL
jgi:hypothetical protein